jgi:hypothetical protein
MPTSATRGFWQSILAVPTMLQEDAFTMQAIYSVYIVYLWFAAAVLFTDNRSKLPQECPLKPKTHGRGTKRAIYFEQKHVHRMP